MSLVLLAVACRPLSEGRVEEGDWLVPASRVSARLDVPCDDAAAGSGPFKVLVDDQGGWTYLHEQGTDRIWLRDPFGVVPDRCWSLPAPDDEEIRFVPGLARAPFVPTSTEIVDGVLLAVRGQRVARLDLTPSDHEPVDDSEDYRTWHRWLEESESDGDEVVAAASTAVVAWDAEAGTWRGVDRATARRHLKSGEAHNAPKGPGVLVGAGPYAAIATEKTAFVLSELNDERPQRDRRDHPVLRDGVIDALVDPETSDLYVLQPDSVLFLPPDGRPSRYPAPGAQGLVLGRPAGEPVVYAWGNDGGGVVYRLEADGNSLAQRLDAPLWGAGMGEVFQELVLVEGGDSATAVGMVDRAHAEALAPGSIGVAWAAFVETPRTLDDERAEALADELGLECAEDATCCVQAARNERVADNLDWLGARSAAVVLGVNPVAVEQARECGQTELAEALRAADAVLSVQVHSAPPEDLAREDELAAWYAAHVGQAALGDPEPDWALLGGGFEGSGIPGAPAWPTLFPHLDLPDGLPPDALYFGGAGMDPDVAPVAAKELAPLDARYRPFPVPVSLDVTEWDGDAGDAGIAYLPGQSLALPWLYEARRSGLLFADFAVHADKDADWTTAQFQGEESASRVNDADVALELHYLVTRVLAHRDVDTARWWWMHLSDLAELSAPPLGEGWVDCVDEPCSRTVLDEMADELGSWSAFAPSALP